jgi:hypothetical protein
MIPVYRLSAVVDPSTCLLNVSPLWMSLLFQFHGLRARKPALGCSSISSR